MKVTKKIKFFKKIGAVAVKQFPKTEANFSDLVLCEN